MTTLATWNVNSIRTRQAHLCQWLTQEPVDLLCVQETKVMDEAFPAEVFQALGYHCYFSGQKAYNGVAFLSLAPLTEVRRGFGAVLPPEMVGDLDDQKRVIACRLGDLWVVNLYVPNGSEPDSEKYLYKLRWLALLKTYLGELFTQTQHLCVVGDFNIALEDRDIHNPKGKDKHIMATPPEREALKALLALGLGDLFRRFTPEGGHFSWWDYRSGGFARDRGWRIDHIYTNAALGERAIACWIDKEPRGWPQPSDHAPVIARFEV